MRDGSIEVIGFCEQAGAALQSVPEVELRANHGIPNDRYAEKRGTFSEKASEKRQLTLIAAEGIEAAYQSLGQDVDYLAPRRNIVVRGFDLASCLGRKLKLGTALIEVMLPCPPCDRLNRLVNPGMKQALADQGGIYARVLESGSIKVGDRIHYADERPRRQLP